MFMKVVKNKKCIAVSLVTVLAVSITMLVASSVSVFATSYKFDFRVQAHQVNSQAKPGRLRGNVPPSNRWWVLLSSSGEGKGALTDFWLEAESGRNVSSYRRVKCGGGWYGQSAYESARSKRVYLTAEDNKDKPSGYNVRGLWQPQD